MPMHLGIDNKNISGTVGRSVMVALGVFASLTPSVGTRRRQRSSFGPRVAAYQLTATPMQPVLTVTMGMLLSKLAM